MSPFYKAYDYIPVIKYLNTNCRGKDAMNAIRKETMRPRIDEKHYKRVTVLY